MMMPVKLTDEQRSELRAFRDSNGRRWKSKLNHRRRDGLLAQHYKSFEIPLVQVDCKGSQKRI